MDIETLTQELTKKIGSLQTELDICKRQKEVTTIIKYLQSIKNIELGYNTIMVDDSDDLDISREGMNDFISLLDPNEYLKAYSSGESNISGVSPNGHKYDISRDCKFYIYYLTLGKGIILELTYSETENIGKHIIVEGEWYMRTFADTQDLSINIDTSYPEHPKLEIIKQDGDDVFGSHYTTNEYIQFNNQKLSETLIPISVNDLANRFANMLQMKENAVESSPKM